MKLIIDNEKEYLIENVEINKLFEVINENLNLKQAMIDVIEIDGVEFVDNFEENISSKLESIDLMVVKTMNEEEFIKKMIQNTRDYLIEVKKNVSNLGIDFYLNKKTEIWNEIIDFIEILSEIFKNFEELKYILEYDSRIKIYEQHINKLIEIVGLIESAMKLKDTVRLGDLISIKVIENLEKMSECLTEILENEVK